MWRDTYAQNQTKQLTELETPKLVVGRISARPKKHYSVLKKLATYLTQKTGGGVQESGGVLVARTYSQMASYLSAGQVHLISETPFAAIRFAQDTGAEILVWELKKGVDFYQTFFFSRIDSDISSLDNLTGKKIAFEDPGSTSAFLVPLAILKERNYDVKHLANPRSPVTPGTVGYSFAEGEKNIVSWVALKVADVGTVSNLDWQELLRTPEKIKQHLRVIYKSAPILRSVIVVSPKLSLETKEKLKAALLEMHKEKLGQAVLKSYKVSKYQELTATALKSLDETREMFRLIRDDIK